MRDFHQQRKSLGVAVQPRKVLGLFVDSVSLSLFLLPWKVKHVEKIFREAGVAKFVSLRNVAKILGNPAWAIQVIPFAQVHYRCTQRNFFYSARSDGDLTTKIRLDEESISNFGWKTNHVDQVLASYQVSGYCWEVIVDLFNSNASVLLQNIKAHFTDLRRETEGWNKET
jgi:hypothetical protein